MESYTAATACPNTTTLAPDGWTFEPQQNNDLDEAVYNMFCLTLPATTPTNWPTEHIDACTAMINCIAVSYSLQEDDNGNLMPFFCYKSSADNLTAVANGTNSTMPRTCMGTMVQNSE